MNNGGEFLKKSGFLTFLRKRVSFREESSAKIMERIAVWNQERSHQNLLPKAHRLRSRFDAALDIA